VKPKLPSIFLVVLAGVVAAEAKGDIEDLLDLGLEELISVEVVSASLRPQPVADVPATVQVITAAMIQERGYRTLADVLQDLPGF
jgi:iron complex outermembrane receptor protein